MAWIEIKGYPNTRTEIKLPRVVGIKEIECITELDERADNQGLGSTLKGLIYGKDYEFKIKKYYKDRLPSDEMINKIIWEYAYSNDEDGVTFVKQKESSGDTFTLKVDNVDMLGKDISVYAYFSKKESGASLDIFCHDKGSSKMYFVAGAGNDLIGWNYSERFERIWTGLGIQGFKKIDVPSGSDYMARDLELPINDILYVVQNREDVANRGSGELAIPEAYKTAHRRVREQIVNELKNKPYEENEQLNLCGYSYGSVVVAQSAIQICDDGFYIDNLVLIGSPVPTHSDLYKRLLEYQSNGKICQIIRHDIKNDKFSNPSSTEEFIEGAMDGSDSNPHFDLARPDNPETPNINEETVANGEIKKLGELLISKGIK